MILLIALHKIAEKHILTARLEPFRRLKDKDLDRLLHKPLLSINLLPEAVELFMKHLLPDPFLFVVGEHLRLKH